MRKASVVPLGSLPIVADSSVSTRLSGLEKQAAKERNLQHMWIYSRSRPWVIERWVDRKAQHESTEGHKPASPRFHLDPNCCGQTAGTLVWRYSCKLNMALGFGLSDWCPLCVATGNRLGWKIMTRTAMTRAKLILRSLNGEVYLHKWALTPSTPGHGEQVSKTGLPLRPTRDECALCQRPEIFDRCHLCSRPCCFKCLVDSELRQRTLQRPLFCFSCHRTIGQSAARRV